MAGSVTPRYRVIVKQPVGGSNFAPGSQLVDFENAKNIGWSEYLNDVGEAFFTISQEDPKILKLRDYIEDDLHIQIYRDDDLVWAGWMSEVDETETDVIIYGHNYLSTLFWLHTAWAQEYAASQINTIVSAEWNAGQAKSNSMTAWMTDGTIEAPVTTSGGATPIVLPLYKAPYKRLLFLMQELAAVSISDTTNRVIFEITPSGTFNFWKNRGTDLTTARWSFGGAIRAFRRYRITADRRNVLMAVGASPTTAVLRDEEGTPPAGEGRREETILLPWVRDETELDRVTKLRLQRAKRVDYELNLTLAAGTVTPYRATGETYRLGDSVPIFIRHGATNIDYEHRLITGQQVVWHRRAEHIRVLMQDRL